jgi:hypothetical protein
MGQYPNSQLSHTPFSSFLHFWQTPRPPRKQSFPADQISKSNFAFSDIVSTRKSERLLCTKVEGKSPPARSARKITAQSNPALPPPLP